MSLYTVGTPKVLIFWSKTPWKRIMWHETKPKMSLADQVKGYKYIINADVHCAALRMRQLILLSFG